MILLGSLLLQGHCHLSQPPSDSTMISLLYVNQGSHIILLSHYHSEVKLPSSHRQLPEIPCSSHPGNTKLAGGWIPVQPSTKSTLRAKSLQLCLTVQPCGLQPIRLLPPWDSPGKSTGVDCHLLLQRIFPTQGSNQHLLRLTYIGRQVLYHQHHVGPSSQGVNKFIDFPT